MASILIIDDEKTILDQLAALVSSFGHAPIHTLHPKYLFQILEAKSVDLILMDVYMPGVDGLSLLKELKSHHSHKTIPVIMLTGDTDEKLLADCFQAGAVDFITKPFKETTLHARIQSALSIQEYISELKESRETAEEATKLKDKFVSLVAHDLRAPFSSILGFLALIQNDKKNPLHPDHQKMVVRAHEAGNRLLRMIEELLNISRLRTGKLVPQKKFFDGRWAASAVVESLKQLAHEKGIELTNKVPHGTRLYADMDLFREVLQNLVSNSIKFCGKDDMIALYVPHGEKTTIAVIDTGVGISDEMLANVFRHEEAMSTPGTAGERGTGLGLPLSHDIMKAHGGELSAASIKGEGTVFYAQLPCIQPEILAIDDDAEVRLFIKGVLEMNDINIIEAKNGEEAIEILEKTTPHLILTDLEMPRMNGYDFLERARENPKTRSIPIIVITGDSNMEARQKAFQLGANDFVTKPLILADLIPRIRRFVG